MGLDQPVPREGDPQLPGNFEEAVGLRAKLSSAPDWAKHPAGSHSHAAGNFEPLLDSALDTLRRTILSEHLRALALRGLAPEPGAGATGASSARLQVAEPVVSQPPPGQRRTTASGAVEAAAPMANVMITAHAEDASLHCTQPACDQPANTEQPPPPPPQQQQQRQRQQQRQQQLPCQTEDGFKSVVPTESDSQDSHESAAPEPLQPQAREAALGGSGSVSSHALQRLHASAIRKSNNAHDTDDVWLHPTYELCVAACIVLNTIWLRVELTLTEPDTTVIVLSISSLFWMVFFFDLVWRLRHEGKNFFLGAAVGWNCFDAVVVLMMAVELLLRSLNAGQIRFFKSLTAIRVLRLTRLLRLVRLVRELKSFSDFRVLVLSIKNGMQALFWVVICSIGITYCFALSLAELAREYCEGADVNEPICEYLGDFSNTILSLYLDLYSGILWDDLVHAVDPLGWKAKIWVAAYLSFTKVIVSNMVLAMLLDVSRRVAENERQVSTGFVIEQRDRQLQELRKLFKSLDLNHSGAISLDELEIAIEDPKIESVFKQLKVQAVDVRELFHLLDADGEGAVDSGEFISGMQRLSGDASKTDVIVIQKQCERILRQLQEPNGAAAKSLVFTSVSDKKHPRTAPGRGRHHQPSLTPLGMPQLFTRRHWKLEQWNFTPHSMPSLFTRSGDMERVEMRAMTLHELRQVRTVIDECCLEEQWQSSTGERISPEEVNLYHFVHNYVGPRTAPQGVILNMPGDTCARVGSRVQQFVSDNQKQAEGEVVEVTEEGPRVQVLGGHFVRWLQLWVDGIDCGQPAGIQAPIALSYKELVSSTPTSPKWFCSHFWGELVSDFIECCAEHARLRGMDDSRAAYWICAYAHRQHSLEEAIGGELEQTSFRKAMHASTGVLLHLDPQATAFARIWCDFEIFCAVNDGLSLDIVTKSHGVPQLLSSLPLPRESGRAQRLREANFPISLLVKGMSAQLQDGKASAPADKDAILNYIFHRGHSDDPEDSLRCANSSLHAIFARAAWPQAIKRGMVVDFDVKNPGALRLPDVLRHDKQRRKLQLSLEHMEAVTDAEMSNIAAALPPNLRELVLSFEGCLHVSNDGLKALALQLRQQPQMQRLKLDFLGCQRLDDPGVRALAQHLPEQLQELELHFDRCDGITDAAVRCLNQHMPRGVKSFSGSFRGTHVDRNFGSVLAVRHYCASRVPCPKGA